MDCDVGFDERRGSSSRFCSAKILEVNIDGKGRFVPEFFILASKHFFVYLRKH